MPPLNHRSPGVVGGAITENAYVQVISDGYHLHPAVVYMLYKIFGTERMVLISDAISACGLPDGEYVSGELPIIVDGETGKLLDGTIAGSIAPLSKCVRKAIEFGIPEEDAFYMASTTPAELLGINKGRLEVGFDADFIVIDDKYNITKTIIGGKEWKNL
jgi:N-acetylglucosamine-6-phosphate deacetylase